MLAGLGSARLVTHVSLADWTGRELAQAEGRWVFSMGGIIGAVGGMEHLVQTAGGEIADGIAEKRGVKMAGKCSEQKGRSR